MANLRLSKTLSFRIVARCIIALCTFYMLGSCGVYANESDTTKNMSRADWKHIIQWNDKCDKGVKHLLDANIGFVGVDRYMLKSGSLLVTVTCKSASYNQGMIVYIRPKASDKYQLLEFPQIAPIAQSTKPIKSHSDFYRFKDSMLWGNIAVDTAKNMLTNTDFFRGGGGCGLHTEYKILDNKVSMVSFKSQIICRSDQIPVNKWKRYSISDISSWPMGEKPSR